MERVGKTFKKQSFRNVITYILVYCMVMNTSLPVVLATPSGGVFKEGGTGTINYGTDTTVTVGQLESVIEWGEPGSGGIDTSSSESLTFLQGEMSNSAVLNKIMSGNLTQFDGTLNGVDMRIFIVNPAGIVFGEGSTVNVAQLVASGLGMSNSAFHDVLDNVNNKMVFSEGTGDVTNNGTINATNSAYLVGVNVTNNGSILCPGGLVVMAAGDTVQLGQPGSNVIVDLADFTFSTNNLNTSGAVGAQHIVLGAGDIWASALTASGIGAASIAAKANDNVVIEGGISASSNAGSDAVATIDIVAGDDVTINGPVRAYSSVDTGLPGDPTNDAISTINIEATGGSVNINNQVQAWSQVYDDSGYADADISIAAGQHVNVNSTDYEYPVEAYAKAKYGSLNANADVDIDAGLNVYVYDGVSAYARTQYDSGDSTALVDIDGTYVYISDKVEAMSTVKYNSGNGMADVVLHADQDVDVGDLVKSWTRTSYDSGNATSKTTVNTGSDVYVLDGSIESWAVTEDNSSSEGAGPNLDATVDIDAYGEVELGGEGNGLILAVAKTGVNASGNMGTITSFVDIDAGLVDVIEGNIAAVAKTGQDSDVDAGDIAATVDIKTIGYEIESDIPGDIYVSDSSEYFDELNVDLSAIEAHAEAGSGITGTAGKVTAIVNLDASGMLDVDDGGVQAEARVGYQQSVAQAGDLTATVDIVTGDSVDVDNGYIEAIAGPIGESPATIGDTSATIHIVSGGDVVVDAEDDDSGIYAEASAGYDNTASVDVTANNGNVDVDADDYGHAGIESNAFNAENNNTADVTVTAKRTDPGDYKSGNVYVTSQYDSDAWIDTETYAGNSNTSTTTINADGDVSVYAFNGSDASIGAYSGYDDESNTANVKITAGGNVDVDNDGMAYAYIEAEAVYGVTNTAGVVITANDGHVEVDSYEGQAWIKAYAYDGVDNTATVTVTAKGQNDVEDDNGDVIVYAEEAEAWIGAYANDAENSNTATTTVNADENVAVEASYGWAGIEAEADNDDETNTANVYITAGGNVRVIAESAEADISAEAYYGGINTAGVEITTTDGYVLVSALDAGADIYAEAEHGVDNVATVDVTAGSETVEPEGDEGDVIVQASAEGEGEAWIGAYANDADNSNSGTTTINADSDVRVETYGNGRGGIESYATNDDESNTSNVNITAGGNVELFGYEGGDSSLYANASYGMDSTAGITIDAVGDVEVVAQYGSVAWIKAESSNSSHNSADVEINAEHVAVMAEIESSSEITAQAQWAYEEESSKNKAEVAIYTHAADVEPDEQSGDVLVEAAMGSGATIQALTSSAYTNTSDVLICADGGVQVYGVMGSNADISAEAVSAYSNTASVGIAAKSDKGVEVRAELDGRAYIESHANSGYENTAETIVCTTGGVEVVDKSLVVTSAGIIAEAFEGYHSDAYVGVRAEDDILVMAGIGPEDLEGGIYGGTGGHAEIRAEASSYVSEYDEEDPPTANAETVVYSLNGGVAVMDATVEEPQPGTAEIISKATGGYTNTAYTGVYAGGDLFNEEHPLYEEYQGIGVDVIGMGDDSRARILSDTSGDYVNTSNTVVCTPYEVAVESEGYYSVAEIGAVAKGDGINAATTQVYADDVYVYNSNQYGQGGIWANAYGWPHVPYLENPVFILSQYDGEYGYHDLVWIEGGGIEDDDIATLKIRDYSKRQDCPVCPPCPCCDEPIEPKPPRIEPAVLLPFVPAAPIPETIVFEISGYPALLSWVARELGVDEGSIEIGVANSLASSKGIQPYNSFSRLRKAAAILRDTGGVYINAMAQVISEYASSKVPPTEEQMAAIANVISRNVGANNQYALAGQYLDALAEYVSILRDEIGFSADEAVRLATDNYIQNLTEGQTGVAAFMAARLSSLAGS